MTTIGGKITTPLPQTTWPAAVEQHVIQMPRKQIRKFRTHHLTTVPGRKVANLDFRLRQPGQFFEIEPGQRCERCEFGPHAL